MSKLGQDSQRVAREFLKELDRRVAELDRPEQLGNVGVLPRDCLGQLTREHLDSLAQALGHEGAKLGLSLQDAAPAEEVAGLTEAFLPLLDKLRSSALLLHFTSLPSVSLPFHRLVVSLLRALGSLLQAALDGGPVSPATGMFLSYSAGLEKIPLRNRPAALGALRSWRQILRDALDELRALIAQDGTAGTPGLEGFEEEDEEFGLGTCVLSPRSRHSAGEGVWVVEAAGKMLVGAEGSVRERVKERGEEEVESEEEVEVLRALETAAKSISEGTDDLCSGLMNGDQSINPPLCQIARAALEMFRSLRCPVGEGSCFLNPNSSPELATLANRLEAELDRRQLLR